MNIIQVILSAIGGTTVLVGLVVFLAKLIIRHMLGKDVEKLKASLRMNILEHEVVFSRLHDRRIEVIADIYAALKDVYRKAMDYTAIIQFSGEPSRDEKRQALAKSAALYFEKFDKQKIWLDEGLAKKIDDFYIQMIIPVRDLAISSDIAKEDPSYLKEMHKKWTNAYQKYEKEVPEAIVSLENEFRRTLTPKQHNS
jgi:hypothetical protein